MVVVGHGAEASEVGVETNPYLHSKGDGLLDNDPIERGGENAVQELNAAR